MTTTCRTPAYLSRVLTALVGCLLLSAGPAHAIPIEFTFTDTLQSSTIPGVLDGDTVTVTIIADNGNATLISQQWFQADVLSATVTAGGYSGTFAAPYLFFDPLFRTDASGVLDLTLFFDTDNGNTDNLGGSAQFLDDAIMTTAGGGGVALFVNVRSSQPGSWVAAPASVPEPSTLWLLGLGLPALVRSHRRRRP